MSSETVEQGIPLAAPQSVAPASGTRQELVDQIFSDFRSPQPPPAPPSSEKVEQGIRPAVSPSLALASRSRQEFVDRSFSDIRPPRPLLSSPVPTTGRVARAKIPDIRIDGAESPWTKSFTGGCAGILFGAALVCLGVFLFGLCVASVRLVPVVRVIVLLILLASVIFRGVFSRGRRF
jgi:hypothetical protein